MPQILHWISTSSTSANTAANWADETGATPKTPASGDTLIFNIPGTANVETNLNQSALTGMTLIIDKAYDGQIGSVSAAGLASYFQLDATSCVIGRTTGQGAPAGTTLCLLDFGDAVNVTTIYDGNTQSGDTFNPPIQLKGSNITLDQMGGSACIAPRRGETSTLNTALNVTENRGTRSPYLYVGPGVTMAADGAATGTTINASGGTLVNASESAVAVLAANVQGGTYIYNGTVAHATLSVPDGECQYSGTGTVTTCSAQGTLDLSRDPRAKTFTNGINVGKGAVINLDNGVAGSLAPVLKFASCRPDECTITLPPGMKFTPALV